MKEERWWNKKFLLNESHLFVGVATNMDILMMYVEKRRLEKQRYKLHQKEELEIKRKGVKSLYHKEDE